MHVSLALGLLGPQPILSVLILTLLFPQVNKFTIHKQKLLDYQESLQLPSDYIYDKQLLEPSCPLNFFWTC